MCVNALMLVCVRLHMGVHVYVHVCMTVCLCAGNTEAELLHTYSKVDPLDTLILCVRLAVLVAVTLTVPVVLFPVSSQNNSTRLQLE